MSPQWPPWGQEKVAIVSGGLTVIQPTVCLREMSMLYKVLKLPYHRKLTLHEMKALEINAT